ncbi:MAG: 30S ribosomal protein S17 [Candidatus Woesearchaeota archaeon]
MIECKDKKCPFHGQLKIRMKKLVGTIVKTDTHRSATIEFERTVFYPKFERYMRKFTKLHAHNPACIAAKAGDKVVIKECRPLSKTKNFVIVEKIGVDRMFAEEQEKKQAGKIRKEKKEEKDESS